MLRLKITLSVDWFMYKLLYYVDPIWRIYVLLRNLLEYHGPSFGLNFCY